MVVIDYEGGRDMKQGQQMAITAFSKTIIALVLCTSLIDSMYAQDRIFRKNYLTDIPFSESLPYSRPAVNLQAKDRILGVLFEMTSTK